MLIAEAKKKSKTFKVKSSAFICFDLPYIGQSCYMKSHDHLLFDLTYFVVSDFRFVTAEMSFGFMSWILKSWTETGTRSIYSSGGFNWLAVPGVKCYFTHLRPRLKRTEFFHVLYSECDTSQLLWFCNHTSKTLFICSFRFKIWSVLIFPKGWIFPCLIKFAVKNTLISNTE